MTTTAAAHQQRPARAPTIYLHIGTMKSGTSYIQGMLGRHRETLRSAGVLYPGERWTDQVEAVRDALAGPGAARRGVQPGRWNAMVERMLEWDGPKALVSMEFLSFASAERVAAIVESLRPAPVHVVITARDLARVIPSAWQESTQNRQTWTWADYLSSISSRDMKEPLAKQRFWNQQDLVDMSLRWAGAVGWGNMHLVTVPQPGAARDDVWRRFCAVVGLDAVAYDGAETVRGNPAIGAGSAEFLRRLNVELGRGLDITAYERVVKRFLAKNTLAYRVDEPRLTLPNDYWDWVVSVAEPTIAWLADSGIEIAGTLDDLRPRQPEASVPTAIAEEAVADAGVHAVCELVTRLGDGGRARKRRGARSAA